MFPREEYSGSAMQRAKNAPQCMPAGLVFAYTFI
jgi:hypothetical protein